MFCFIMGRIRRISKKIRAPVIYRIYDTQRMLPVPACQDPSPSLRCKALSHGRLCYDTHREAATVVGRAPLARALRFRILLRAMRELEPGCAQAGRFQAPPLDAP